ncbi:hypothetical protein FVEG_15316 [Fusarium verticillioides 7600]|uniref:Uncharacterized protein n=1 Tax=Gibberella moniliformis (strain M3125 / FGSC 7600) TaxID=334819 RepID=W7LSQ6_GIBM7|nr:hypothetical protein FVEG_15316 [Fusarium verticillioides 7600]XP_018747788.1 hypothetical protein FVEG_15316 [Fusarium verticillioides 7600]EWG41596.1 hypothetical protein FVEG_15316 [Fusarium verticillioides 7600]EWG41597.1 hypothetical protein FVEG_15316 [Fusarium verticillioides 7600]
MYKKWARNSQEPSLFLLLLLPLRLTCCALLRARLLYMLNRRHAFTDLTKSTGIFHNRFIRSLKTAFAKMYDTRFCAHCDGVKMAGFLVGDSSGRFMRAQENYCFLAAELGLELWLYRCVGNRFTFIEKTSK